MAAQIERELAMLGKEGRTGKGAAAKEFVHAWRGESRRCERDFSCTTVDAAAVFSVQIFLGRCIV